ncbi:MAG: DUF2357 domain-containing protein [Acidobacteria bacterium]|nr:MAG: DUF2357 domain-containing protein [Acidobacteriota bacterium]REK06119.1 MAG: DUF2357 domain-containing protein [Acidobacteriota bacterium]
MSGLESGLRLSTRRGGLTPKFVNGRVLLDSRQRWVVEGPKPRLEAVAASLGSMAERLGSVVLLDFGNSVGQFEVPGIGTVEVHSSKWRSDDFDAMLAELTRVAAELPFAADRAGALPYDRTLVAERDVLYHLFVYLRYALSERGSGEEALIPALAAIVRDPHRKLLKVAHRSPLALARDVRPGELAAIVSGARPMLRARGAIAGSTMAVRMGGQVPEEVDEVRTRWTLDTPENRFVKSFLDLVAGVLDRIEEVFSGSKVFEATVRADCARMRHSVEGFRRAGMWRDVGRLAHFPAASTVLRGRRGYKGVLRCYVRMRLGSRLPLDEEQARRLLEIRDIADLYELWCYFRMVEEVSRVLGTPAAASRFRADHRQVKVPYDFRVRWPGGQTLDYNSSFRRSASSQRRSYSVPLRPDIALEIPEGPAAGLHLFDAKFKLDSLTGLAPQGDQLGGEGGEPEHGEGDEAIEAEEKRGHFQRGDLYKMHTYRDAIPKARTAWILYPGSESRFFAAEGEFEGVGAIPLVPGGKKVDEIGRLLAVHAEARVSLAKVEGRRSSRQVE